MGSGADGRGKVPVTLCASLWAYVFSVMFDYLSLEMLRVNKWTCFAENTLVVSFGTPGVHSTGGYNVKRTFSSAKKEMQPW